MNSPKCSLDDLKIYMNKSVPKVCSFVREVREIQFNEFENDYSRYTVVVDCEEDLCDEDLFSIYYRVSDSMKFFGFDDHAHEVKISHMDCEE